MLICYTRFFDLATCYFFGSNIQLFGKNGQFLGAKLHLLGGASLRTRENLPQSLHDTRALQYCTVVLGYMAGTYLQGERVAMGPKQKILHSFAHPKEDPVIDI